MNKSVIYFNKGNKCIIRLCVSIASLRKHWEGKITLVHVGSVEPMLEDFCEDYDVIIKRVDNIDKASLVVKASIHKYIDTDLNLFLDADTLVVNKIDSIFEIIESEEFVVHQFNDWHTKGSKISSRIRDWAKYLPEEYITPAIEYGPAINTGVFGWKKGAKILDEWGWVTERGYQKNCTRRIVDEIACQILLPRYKCKVVGPEWGCSVKFGKITDKTKIIHYHGSKHCGNRYEGCVLWKKQYHELLNTKAIIDECYGDRALRGYIKDLRKKYDLTVVTAVSNSRFQKFENNISSLLNVDVLKNHHWIIFAHKDMFDKVTNLLYSKMGLGKDKINVVKWEFPIAESEREEMLSSFVFGVAKFVKTKYWAKIDCDCRVKDFSFNIPDEIWQHTLSGHKWGYTKVKGDDISKGHWLNRLDDWADNIRDFEGTERLFKEKIDGKRYSHARICTFFAIEKTAWTKHLAKMCGDRMPIPSQDTLSWYGITRLGNGRKILRTNFKKWFSP